jgi:hypothetical protein
MLLLPVLESSWTSQNISLGGLDYEFIFSYNTRDSRWRFDIYLEGEPVVLGIKVVENQMFLRKYILPLFNHGDIACLRLKNDGLPVGRNNLGQGRSYELIYFTNEELQELGLI